MEKYSPRLPSILTASVIQQYSLLSCYYKYIFVITLKG